ncbi:uncharacterized protein LOC134823248 [Bolinopsis microptera]|uniref:uncharacterized protein LOC134823248 n=1 Tax=Bolinopsis microptera TaxID=2820187 RepID=UPI00307ABE63
MSEVVGETSDGGVSLATNMADMTKIRTQLARKEYKEERNMWSQKVATVECHHFLQDLNQCLNNHFYFKCAAKAMTWFNCKHEAAEVFKEEYDKVKIKEYIKMMKEQEETGRIVDATESHSDHQFFQNG